MKKAIELRFAVLTNLAMLLWLLVEFVIGFQDKYIAWYPLITLCSLVVPVLCYRRALLEKREDLGHKFTLRTALFSGFLLSLFTGIFSIPVQLFFLKVINPDFMDDFIRYEVTFGKQTLETVAMYINLQSLVAENVIFTFVSGIIIALILAFRLRVS